jgi:2-amino-4-hydroxy-6-hydroxymethyldihydropteridine diphosphokinase
MTDPAIEIGLSLGSNLGDRMEYLDEAVSRISDLPAMAHVERSPVYETAAIDVPAEFSDVPFLNLVLVGQSCLDPRELLPHLHELESAMGRTRPGVRNSPRPIDVDIIYAGELEIESAELIVPHPRWAERLFVVKPLHDLRPDLRVPGSPLSVSELLEALPSHTGIARVS